MKIKNILKDIIDSDRSWMYEIIDNDIALMNSEGTIVYRIPYDEFMINVDFLKKKTMRILFAKHDLEEVNLLPQEKQINKHKCNIFRNNRINMHCRKILLRNYDTKHSTFWCEGEQHPIYVKECDKIVGLVMPLRISK